MNIEVTDPISPYFSGLGKKGASKTNKIRRKCPHEGCDYVGPPGPFRLHILGTHKGVMPSGVTAKDCNITNQDTPVQSSP